MNQARPRARNKRGKQGSALNQLSYARNFLLPAYFTRFFIKRKGAPYLSKDSPFEASLNLIRYFEGSWAIFWRASFRVSSPA